MLLDRQSMLNTYLFLAQMVIPGKVGRKEAGMYSVSRWPMAGPMEQLKNMGCVCVKYIR